jgi:hypothetical protein
LQEFKCGKNGVVVVPTFDVAILMCVQFAHIFYGVPTSTKKRFVVHFFTQGDQ